MFALKRAMDDKDGHATSTGSGAEQPKSQEELLKAFKAAGGGEVLTQDGLAAFEGVSFSLEVLQREQTDQEETTQTFNIN